MKQKFAIKTFFLLVTLCSISNAFSQTISPGIQAGVNLSNWNVSGASGTGLSTSSLTNPEFGLFVNIKTAKSFSIEPGITYTTAGSIFKYEGDENETTFNLSYLQFPLLARYHVSKRISLFTGPQAGFLLKATATDMFGEKQPAKFLFKKNDVALVSGFNYYLPIGISIGLKYAAGFTAIYSKNGQTIKNYSFGLNAAYQFQPAKRK